MLGKKILTKHWKDSFPFIMGIYVGFEIIITFSCTMLKGTFSGYETYKYAAYPICAIFFWIVIIQFNFNLFNNTYEGLKELIQDCGTSEKVKKLDEWKNKFEREFDISIDAKGLIIYAVAICFDICGYLLLARQPDVDVYKAVCKVAMVLLITAGGLYTICSKGKKTFKISAFVALCGLSYYVYIVKFFFESDTTFS